MKSRLEKDIETLFAASENISDKMYTNKQIKGLPDPVQRYFRYSLHENKHYISYVRLIHGGKFRKDQKWVSIEGQEYFTIQKPGFIWLGKVPLISAKDTYSDGKGNMLVKLLSLVRIIDAKGKEIDQGALLRWLSETPWFPTALLPSEKLKWESTDNNSAKVILIDKNLTVEGVFYFNEMGQIIQFKANRYKDKTLENWTCHYSNYKKITGMHIPFLAEAAWNLEAGDYRYAKFKINTIEYNNPLKFK